MSEAQGRVGRWLRNKWHLDSLIAIGGMAAVYSSTHRNGARAAIKLLHSQYTRNEQARRRFLAEGYAANKVGHRNAVLVLDDDTTEDGEVYLVMELLDGESLEGRLERVGVMSPMEVLELTDQLLEVLSYAHPKGILHRDIKPANIYLTRDGAVKLLDFGLARVRELSAEAMDQSDGIVFGTVSYIAPEQARADNQNLDARSDLWSIAATMFRALSGETVHPSTGPIIDRLLAVARKPARSIATVCPHLPRPVVELIDRALAFDPEARWPSANVMRVVVQDVVAQLQEEAEAAQTDAEPELELQTSTVFGRHGTTPPARPKTGPDLPNVRVGGSAPTQERPPRPRTDPAVIGGRPQTLPAHAVPATPDAAPAPIAGGPEDEVDLDVEAMSERPDESRKRRSRTLLTKEGRAELRRILDARKAGLGLGEPRDESTPTFTSSAPQAAAQPDQAADPGESDDVDMNFDDSVVEVTIDHTRQARPGPIAEVLADPVTPAPISLPRDVPEDRSSRQTGGFPAVGSRTTGSYASLGAGRAPEPPATGPRARASVPEDSSRASALDETARRRAAAMASLDDTARRRAEAASSSPVPEDRRARTASASYPTLGGPSSRPFDVSASATRGADPAGPSSVSGEINTGTTPAGDEVARPAPVVVSGEIVTGPSRATEITRVGAPPAPVEAPTTSRPGEITRVGQPPLPPTTARPAEPPRAATVTSGLHDTIRPKTIPPLGVYRPSRPTPVGEPSAPLPDPTADSTKRAALGRAGVFAAPGRPTTPAGAPPAGSQSTSASTAGAPRPATDPPQSASASTGGARPTLEPPRPASASTSGAPRPTTDPPRSASASTGGAPRPTTDPSQSASASTSGAPRPTTDPPQSASASTGGAPRLPIDPPQSASASTGGAPRLPIEPPRATSPAAPSRPKTDPPQVASPVMPTRPAIDPPQVASPVMPTRPATDPPQVASPVMPSRPATDPPRVTAPIVAPRPKTDPGSPAPTRPATDPPRMSAARVGEPQRPATTPPRAAATEGERPAPVSPVATGVPAAEAAAARKPDEPVSSTPAVAPRSSSPAAKSMFNPYPTLSAGGPAVPKDSPASAGTQPVPKTGPLSPSQQAAARAAAPTAPQPVVGDIARGPEPEPPARGPNEPRAKTGAVPVLPFSFLRPGAPAARPGTPPADPQADGDPPPRKKP